MVKFTIACVLIFFTMNALISYELVETVHCSCSLHNCVIFDGNNSFLRNPETYCSINMKKVYDISMLHFNETTLAPDVFDTYKNLSSFSVWYGSIEHIKPGVFEKLSKLRMLELRNQNFSTLEDYTFRGLGALSILDLHSNNLTSIAPNAFDGLNRLALLTLSGNKLTHLPAKLIRSSPKLISISFSENMLTRLPDGIFDYIDSLHELDVSHNRLKTFNFPKLKTTKLSLQNNLLSSLHINDYVKIVLAHHNRIRTIEGTGLNVTELRLYNNAISNVTSITRMPMLEKLILSNNPLQPDSVFASIPYLQEFELSNTNIEINNNTFDNLSSMMLLNISYNNLMQLDFRMFSSMIELETLIVSHNRIQMINFIELREYLPNLRILEVCGNGWNATYLKRIQLQMQNHKVSVSLLAQSSSNGSCLPCLATTSKPVMEDSDSEDSSDDFTEVQESSEFYPTSTIPPDDQQEVEGSSVLKNTFQVLGYTLNVLVVVCLAMIGYYLHRRRSQEYWMASVDSNANAV